MENGRKEGGRKGGGEVQSATTHQRRSCGPCLTGLTRVSCWEL